MKKISKRGRSRQLRTARLHWEAKLRQRKKLALRRNKKGTRKAKPLSIAGLKLLYAPQNLALTNTCSDNEPVFAMLAKVEREFGRSKRGILLDFSHLEWINAPGATVLHATLEQLSDNAPSKVVKCRNITHRYYRKVLAQSELHGLANQTSDAGSEVLFPFKKYVNVASHARGELIEWLQSKTVLSSKFDADIGMRDAFANAIGEAGLNVVDHAYPDSNNQYDLLDEPGAKSPMPWWLYGQVVDDQLHLVLYDRGVGIPQTMRRKPTEQINMIARLATLRGNDDGNMIRGALEMERSGSPLHDGHGKGLSQIKRLVSLNNEGKFGIFSNRGLCTYDNSNGRYGIDSGNNTLKGTLICWNVSLSSLLDGEVTNHE